MNQTNLSSGSPTKDYIIHKSQAIVDQNYDDKALFKRAQVEDDEWWCWNFEHQLTGDQATWPWSALPRYRRVRKLKLKHKGSKCFLWCDCGFYDRIGYPCSHIFCVVGEMSLNMFHISNYDGPRHGLSSSSLIPYKHGVCVPVKPDTCIHGLSCSSETASNIIGMY